MVDKCTVIKKSGDNDELRQAFDYFDVHEIGKIEPKYCLEAMKSLNYDVKNPVLFKVMEQLDTPENNKNLVNFEQFSDHINKRFEDSLTEEGLKRMFDLSLDDPKQETITFTTLKNICNQLGEDISNEELREILSK